MSTETDPSVKHPTKYAPGHHPNSRKNLVVGDIGQDHSRTGYSITSRVKDYLGKPLKPPPPDAPARDLIAYSAVQGAILREPTPFREVWDRIDGKVSDPDSKLTFNDIHISITYESSTPQHVDTPEEKPQYIEGEVVE